MDLKMIAVSRLRVMPRSEWHSPIHISSTHLSYSFGLWFTFDFSLCWNTFIAVPLDQALLPLFLWRDFSWNLNYLKNVHWL